ncbi:uncharacterized protein [Mobula birostris]|uniref:uncharacterized protein isoform X2 n=1 Tax=Mobula birostris TaxID=1983395 RepID=UPI003B27C7C9
MQTVIGSNCGLMMILFLLPLVLLVLSVPLVYNGADTHLDVKGSAAYPRPDAGGREVATGSFGSSMLLDPKFTVNRSKEEVVWEWKNWNSTKSLVILDHVPSRSSMFPSEQFEHRLQFNISNCALTINPLERRDEGIYIVYVQGEKKKEVVLHVYEELSDAMILANFSSLSSTIQLTCNVSGDHLKYQWRYNGGEILKRHQLMDGNRTLMASKRDCGTFTCVATNLVNSVRANYTQTVPGILSENIAIVVLFIIELAVSLCRIVPVLLCCWKEESALMSRKCLLCLNLTDILLLLIIFIAFIYWIMVKGVAFISVLVLCTMPAQLLALILPFIIRKLSCPPIKYIQKFLGAWDWILYIVVVIASVTFFVIYGINPGCDSSPETWRIFFFTRIWTAVVFFLSVVAQYCRDKRGSEDGSTVKGEQDDGEVQELKQSAPDHPDDQ